MALEGEFERIADNKFYALAYNRFIDEGKLMGSKCQNCGAIYVPPRPICPKCRARKAELIEMKGKGKIAAFTVVTVGPPMMCEEGFDRDNPYCTGVIELDEGARVTARIAGVDMAHPDQIKIGTPVTVEYPKYKHGGEEKTFLTFRPVA
jgi:uncharacterized OB-fold protein